MGHLRQFLKVNVSKCTMHLSVWVCLFHLFLAAGDFGVDTVVEKYMGQSLHIGL